MEHIQIVKIQGGKMSDSYLDEGFILNKKIGVGQPTRIENAKILIANTAMDTDKIKIYGKFLFESLSLSNLSRTFYRFSFELRITSFWGSSIVSQRRIFMPVQD